MTDMQMPFLWAILCISILGIVAIMLGRKRPIFIKLTCLLAVVEAILSAILLIIRGKLGHALPLSNGADFALWLIFIFCVAVLLLVRRKYFYNAAIGMDLMSACLALWMLSLNLDVTPLAPALRSPWLAVHVMMAILSYSCLSVSFVLSVLLLLRSKKGVAIERLHEAQELDYWSYRLVVVGMPLLTLMMITGSVWAEYSWGSYWSWDWKETWALITWLVYALYLHLRVSGWKFKKAAILNLVGFAVVIFTFFGVSYLLPGLHSYLK